jgi:hypothetical protein
MTVTAKITAKDGYRCAPRGSTIETIPFGEIVTGQIAEWALADKAASRMVKKGPAPENKARRPRETKAGK